MERVKMRSCGDGYRRADAGSFSPFKAVTAEEYTLRLTDAGRTFSNRGATDPVILYLPKPKEGYFIRIEKVASEAIWLEPSDDEKIDGVAAPFFIPQGASGLITVATDGTDWFTSIGRGSIFYHEVKISSEDITKTEAGGLSSANGYPLVAAPGSVDYQWAPEFVSAVLFYKYDTAAYADGGNVTVNWDDGGAAVSVAVTAANGLGAAEDKIVQLVPVEAANALQANTGFNLKAATAFTNPGTAAGTVRVGVSYRVHLVG